MPGDIRILGASCSMERVRAREPLKFGAVVVPESTYCVVTCEVETRSGRRARGRGGILLMDFWAFPAPEAGHGLRERAMAELTRRYCRAAADCPDPGHPVELALRLEEALAPLAAKVQRDLALPVPLPRLAQLVCASPLDAALHDAFGNANGIPAYSGYGPDFMDADLSAWLGPEFRGSHVADYVRPAYPTRIPVFHLVGGLDAIRERDVEPDAPGDGLPNSLEGWIERDGLTCLKVKLKGTDLAWDLARLREVHAVAREAHRRLGVTELHTSADTNEQCESPAYAVELLRKLREAEPGAFEALLYLEQPTSRDLRGVRHDMAELAALKPVIVDESLTSLEDFELAMELNWSGVALKTCKGQSWSLLFAALARRRGIPYTVQDLTNPDIALVQSAGLAGRLYPLMGVEANSCQYFPAANRGAARVHEGVFRRRDGALSLESIRGPGLGYRWEEMATAERPGGAG